ncbi:MAG TPA: choice-of-anchor tandem repeat GloVer-containing protein, partial [Tepidisphaeraceae bacterium]
MEAVERRVLLSAYTLNQLGSFGINATGVDPASTLVADSAGNLYGTASAGGPYGQGTIFEIAHGSNAITTLASFNGTNGSTPWGTLAIDPSGNLYGATTVGGPYPNSNGTVFELAQGSNVVTTLAAFNGAYKLAPFGGVTLDSSGNLFWTAQGGNNGDGAVFELAKGSPFPTMVDFIGANGAYPYAGITCDASGNVYGTTTGGGAYGYGTVFEIASGSNTITTIASFNSWSQPEAALTLDPSGDLLGTTHNGGTFGLGTVFEIAKG